MDADSDNQRPVLDRRDTGSSVNLSYTVTTLREQQQKCTHLIMLTTVPVPDIHTHSFSAFSYLIPIDAAAYKIQPIICNGITIEMFNII